MTETPRSVDTERAALKLKRQRNTQKMSSLIGTYGSKPDGTNNLHQLWSMKLTEASRMAVALGVSLVATSGTPEELRRNIKAYTDEAQPYTETLDPRDGGTRTVVIPRDEADPDESAQTLSYRNDERAVAGSLIKRLRMLDVDSPKATAKAARLVTELYTTLNPRETDSAEELRERRNIAGFLANTMLPHSQDVTWVSPVLVKEEQSPIALSEQNRAAEQVLLTKINGVLQEPLDSSQVRRYEPSEQVALLRRIGEETQEAA